MFLFKYFGIYVGGYIIFKKWETAHIIADEIYGYFGIYSEVVPKGNGKFLVTPDLTASNPAVGDFNTSKNHHIVTQLFMQGEKMEIWNMYSIDDHIPANILYQSGVFPEVPSYGGPNFHSQHCIAAIYLAQQVNIGFSQQLKILHQAGSDLLLLRNEEVEDYMEALTASFILAN